MTRMRDEYGRTLLPGVEYVITSDELDANWINQQLDGFKSVDCYNLMSKFSGDLQACEDDEWPRLKFLVGLTSIMLVNNSKDPFQRMMVNFDGRSSLSPHDLLPGQIDVIKGIAPYINNPGLRARLADISWYISNSLINMANLAVDSYRDCVDKVQMGEMYFDEDVQSSWEIPASTLLRRAAEICSQNDWVIDSANKFKEKVIEVIPLVAESGKPVAFHRIASIVTDHSGEFKVDYSTLASQYMKNAEQSVNKTALSFQVEIWNAAEACLNNLEEIDSADAEHTDIQTKSESVKEQLQIEISDIKRIIESLGSALSQINIDEPSDESIESVVDEVIDLCKVLFSEIEKRDIHIDGSKASQIVENEIRQMSFDESLDALFNKVIIPDSEVLRNALKRQEDSNNLSSAILQFELIENGAGIVAKGLHLSETIKRENHEEAALLNLRAVWRMINVIYTIEPWRKEISKYFRVSEEILKDCIEKCDSIPSNSRKSLVSGAERFLHGNDFVSLHLLVFQVENVFRHFLSSMNDDGKIEEGALAQNNMMLRKLLRKGGGKRSLLEQNFDKNMILEVEQLLLYLELRNKMAHGDILESDLHSTDAIFTSWLILKMIGMHKGLGGIDEANESKT